MSDEKELELKIVQKRVKRLWMLAIISFVAVVLMTVSYIVYGYLPQKMAFRERPSHLRSGEPSVF